MHTKLGTGLADDLTQALAHRALQNLEAVFCDPHDVKTMVEPRMRA
jgi:hypothetical protein